MSASDVRERAILDAEFGASALSPPATWYIGLSTTTPGDDGSGFTEPAGGSYARVAKTNNATNFPAATTTSGVSEKKNGTAITFPNPTATWGLITHVGFFSASTGGTPLHWFALTNPIQVNSGNTPVEFAINALAISAD